MNPHFPPFGSKLSTQRVKSKGVYTLYINNYINVAKYSCHLVRLSQLSLTLEVTLKFKNIVQIKMAELFSLVEKERIS